MVSWDVSDTIFRKWKKTREKRRCLPSGQLWRLYTKSARALKYTNKKALSRRGELYGFWMGCEIKGRYNKQLQTVENNFTNELRLDISRFDNEPPML
jgi:hypothetical protein